MKWFGKKTADKPAADAADKPVADTADWSTMPITVKYDDFNDMREKIRLEYAKTAENHKKPTEYMRGLSFALNVIDDLDATIKL